MATIAARAQQYADALAGAGARAYTDPAEAHSNRPCFLVAPPVIDWTEGTLAGGAVLTWRLIALSSYAAGSLPALDELQALIAHAEAAVELERGEPIRYTMTAGGQAVAAYVLTTSDLLDSLS